MYSYICVMDGKIILRKRLLNLSIPIFIESLLIILLGTMDTIMLSRFSDSSVASVGVVNQVFNMIIVVFQVSMLGTSVLCSQYLGAGNNEKVRLVAWLSLFFNFFLGIIISTFLFFESELVLRWMRLDPSLMDEGVKYFRIVGGLAFIQSLSITISAILRSVSLAKYPMMVTGVINILNCFGNYVLIFGNFGMPALGAEGAAIATGISRIIALVILAIIVYKKVLPSFPKNFFTIPSFNELKTMLRIGMPAAGESMSYSLSQVVVTMFINMIAVEVVATRTYVMNVVMFTYMFALAISMGNSILVGQLIGEQRKEDAYKICLFSQYLSLGVTTLIAGFMAGFGTMILGLLTDNPDIIKLGAIILCIDFILEFGRSVNMMMVNALRSTGDAVFPVVLGLFSMWGFAVGVSWILGINMGYGLIGMWCAFALDECFRAVILLKRWKSKKWMKRNIISYDNPPINPSVNHDEEPHLSLS